MKIITLAIAIGCLLGYLSINMCKSIQQFDKDSYDAINPPVMIHGN